MTLDDRPAIEQLLDPEPVVYCVGCGTELPEHAPGCWR